MIDTGLKTHLAVGSSKNSCLGTKQTTCSGGRRQQSIAVKNEGAEGRLGGTAVKRLPSAQGVVPALRDRAPHQALPL